MTTTWHHDDARTARSIFEKDSRLVEQSAPMMFSSIRSVPQPVRPILKERHDAVLIGRRAGRQRRHQAPFEEAPILDCES